VSERPASERRISQRRATDRLARDRRSDQGDRAAGPRQISLVLPHGMGLPLQTRLFKELGLTRVDLHSARGFMGTDPGAVFGRIERDVLQVVVDEERAAEVFEWLYREAHVAEQEGRFLYVARLARATPHRLPEAVPLEVRKVT
jgi:hypothetical protein